MLPESTNGTGGTSGGELAVPMAWLCAEYVADEVLRAAALVAPGSLEYRSGLQALALTVHLTDEPDGPHAPDGGRDTWPLFQADEWLRHTAYDRPWPPWVEERLARRLAAHGDGPDLALARTAWHRLRDTWVRAADLDGPVDAETPVDEAEQIWLPAWKLGLPLAHLSLHLR
ncbi:hypothetical protein AB0G79_12975 [Streptomyces sp. NPDC020807]|uniref:hypothetical protein n=1 Tax=Streptomyces sp. NPDC020807 TaxID=3155119 RepID=UPI00340EEAD7